MFRQQVRRLLPTGLLLLIASHVAAQETDAADGLIIAEGWQQVQETCTECHSSLLITQNAGNKAVWRTRIRWMQDTQGLQQLSPALEETILDYLSTHYGEKAPSRRPGLAAELLPVNPYAVDSTNE